MAIYNYSALDNVGKKTKGQMTASNELDLEAKLQEFGLDLIDFKELTNNTKSKKTSIPAKDMIVFCIQLEQLEKAGVPLLDALGDIRDSAETQTTNNLLSDISDSIKNGMIFSAALATHPEVFDKVFVGLVAAGEKTGQLHIIFSYLAEHLKWNYAMKAKIKQATIYPLFLLTLMSAITGLMMLYVIPKLSLFLTTQNFELPSYTKALIATSDFMKSYWPLIFFGPIVLFFCIRFACKVSPAFSYTVDGIKLKLPVFGSLIKKMEITKFCRFFSITYKSGIGILECLEIACNVVHNLVIKEGIQNARTKVSEGSSLTEALKGSNQFSTLVLRMVKVGEDGGNLDQTLENVNFFYDKEVTDGVNKLIGMIQPALTILMGGLMFWVTVAVFGPLYGSFSKMSL
jgi:type IV pilus assembly protein PilC